MRPSGTYTGANHRSVKQTNRATIFRAIHALGPVARVDLAHQTGLNPGTVSHIVDELLAVGLVNEAGQRPSGRAGRRAVVLAINPTARYAIGVDLAKSELTAAVVDLGGRVHAREVEPTTGPWREDWAVPTAVRMVDRLLERLTPARRHSLVGVGIGAPSPVSIRTRRYLPPPTFDEWHDLELQDELERRLGLPTHADNNGNASALAELWFGAGQGVDNFALLNLGTGVGTGLVFGGELYRGDHDLAGEAGHITINVDGPRCSCGNVGCLEMYVSVPRVLDFVRGALAAGEPSVLCAATARDDDALSIDAVITALRDRDPLTCRVFAEVARHLAAGVVNVVHTLDPQLILLGRELSHAQDALLAPLRAELDQRNFVALRDTVRLEIAAVPDAPVVGAATLALAAFFQTPLEQPA